MTEETKKKRPDLGIAIPVQNKKTPQSYDLSGNIVVEGKKFKFGAYRSTASGNGKMAKGSEYYYFYRQFLGHKLMMHGVALTRKDLPEKFMQAGLSKSLEEKAMKLAQDVERLDYGEKDLSDVEKNFLVKKCFLLF